MNYRISLFHPETEEWLFDIELTPEQAEKLKAALWAAGEDDGFGDYPLPASFGPEGI